jgi:hypothetical protein
MSTQTHELGWVPTVESFGTRLAMIRQTMSWNAKEAALACGLPAQSWREWEMTGRLPRNYAQACQRIAERTGADLLWLLTGVTQPSPGTPTGRAVTSVYLAGRPHLGRSSGLSLLCSNALPNFPRDVPRAA